MTNQAKTKQQICEECHNKTKPLFSAIFLFKINSKTERRKKFVDATRDATHDTCCSISVVAISDVTDTKQEACRCSNKNRPTKPANQNRKSGDRGGATASGARCCPSCCSSLHVRVAQSSRGKLERYDKVFGMTGPTCDCCGKVFLVLCRFLGLATALGE